MKLGSQVILAQANNKVSGIFSSESNAQKAGIIPGNSRATFISGSGYWPAKEKGDAFLRIAFRVPLQGEGSESGNHACSGGAAAAER